MATKYIPEVMDETARDAIVDPLVGLIICNSTTNKLDYFDGTVWVEIGGGGGGSWELVEKQIVGDDAVIDFVLPDTTSWFRFVFARIFIELNNKSLRGRVSTDGGTSFIETTTYGYVVSYAEGTAIAAITSAADTSMWFTRAKMRNSVSPTVGIIDYWGNVGAKRGIFHSRMGVDNSAARAHYSGTSLNTTTTAINAIRFFVNSGNFASGQILLYKNTDIVLT